MKCIILAMIMTCTLYCNTVSSKPLGPLQQDDKCVKTLAKLYNFVCGMGIHKSLVDDSDNDLIQSSASEERQLKGLKNAELCCHESCTFDELVKMC